LKKSSADIAWENSCFAPQWFASAASNKQNF
jgi:hypothetical protein